MDPSPLQSYRQRVEASFRLHLISTVARCLGPCSRGSMRFPQLRRRTAPRLTLAAALALLLALAPQFSTLNAADLQIEPRPDIWVPNGPVHAMVATNGLLYLGGEFDSLTPRHGQGVAVDLNTLAAKENFPAVHGDVFKVIPDGSGGFFLGGSFHSIDGLPAANLAHLTAEHRVNTGWLPQTDGPVNLLARQGRTLYIGGLFTEVNGQPRNHLAAVDIPSGEILDWNPGLADGARVYAMASYQESILVSGLFTAIGGQARNGLAALDAGTAQVLPWNPNPGGGTVVTMAVLNDTVYLGGNFSTMQGQSRPALAAVQAITGELASWNPGPKEGEPIAVLSLAASDEAIYVGGRFSLVGQRSRLNLAALDPLSGVATPWNPDPVPPAGSFGTIFALAVSDQSVFVGGQFSEIGGTPREGWAAVDRNLGSAQPWTVASQGSATSIAVSWRTVFAAGPRLITDAIPRQNLAALDAVTGQPVDWQADTDGTVTALHYAHGHLYVGGDFRRIRGVSRGHLAALNPHTGAVLEGWEADLGNTILAMASTDTALFVGGEFSMETGINRSYLAAFSATDGRLLDWNPSPNAPVRTMVADRTDIYVGGDFTMIGESSRPYLAGIDRNGQVLDLNLPINSSVFALARSGSRLYLGGAFTGIGDLTRLRLAEVSLNTGSLTAFDPSADNVVRSLCLLDQTLIAGGVFSAINGFPARYLAQIDRASSRLTEWRPVLTEQVLSLAPVEGALGVGLTGLSARNGGEPFDGLRLYPSRLAPRIDLPPDDLNLLENASGVLSVTASGNPPLSYQWHRQNEILPGATQSHLTVTNDGAYHVVVSNEYGQVQSAKAVVTTLIAPVIVEQSDSRVVSFGANVTLEAVASGSPDPIYRWTRNGVEIPGAIGSSLNLTSVTPADGGTYQAAASNPAGVAVSAPIVLKIKTDPFPFADHIADSITFSETTATLTGHNRNATFETDEPLHAGIVGGKSVWAIWTPPVNGVAQLSTLGSSFDTLLGVYTTSRSGKLAPVAGDDDRGGFAASEVLFNAIAGTHYFIAVDGYNGASGDIVLQANLTSGRFIAEITNKSTDAAVLEGGNATFFVDAISDTPISYQWYHDGHLIPGATSNSLNLSAIQFRDVGQYTVELVNANRSKLVAAAFDLQISPFFPPPFDGKPTVPYSGSASFGVDSRAAFSFGINSLLAPPPQLTPCQSVVASYAAMTNLVATVPGTFIIDTSGSTFRSVASVFTGTPPTHTVVQCVTTNAPNAFDCRLKFSAVPNEPYTVLVGGLNTVNVGDKANVTISFCAEPVVPTTPGTNWVPVQQINGQYVFQVPEFSAFCDPSYQWFQNGLPIPGATGAAYTNNSPPSAGDAYSVVVTTCGGSTTAILASFLELSILPMGTPPNLTYRLHAQPVLAHPYIVQTLSPTSDWMPFHTNDANQSLDINLPTLDPLRTNHLFRVWPSPPNP